VGIQGLICHDSNSDFLRAGDLNFYRTSYQWLVVTGSNYARYKGSGSINGELAPDGQDYKLIIWAGDGDQDTYRIKIWYEDAESNEIVVYDNGFDQGISGGSIVVHTK